MKDCSVSTAAIWAAASRKARPCGVDRRGQHREQVGVGRGLHLGPEIGPQPVQAGFVIGQAVGHRRAHHLGAVGIGQRRGVGQMRGHQFFRLLARHRPVAASPIDVGAQPPRIVGLVHRHQVQRIVPLLQRGKGARFQQQAGMHLVIGQAGDLRIADRRHRRVRLVIHQIDRRQPRGDLGLGDAVQPLVHLIGQQRLRPGPADPPPPAGRDMRRIISSPSAPMGVRSILS